MDQKNEEKIEKKSSTSKFEASVLDAVLLAEVGAGLRGQELAEHQDVVLQIEAVLFFGTRIERLI